MSQTDVEQVQRPLRRDARESHDKLIAAAQAEFAARGVEASLEKIARDAGVAIGTLYRHFPARLDLLMAALRPRLQEFVDGADEAMATGRPVGRLRRLPGEPVRRAGRETEASTTSSPAASPATPRPSTSTT